MAAREAAREARAALAVARTLPLDTFSFSTTACARSYSISSRLTKVGGLRLMLPPSVNLNPNIDQPLRPQSAFYGIRENVRMRPPDSSLFIPRRGAVQQPENPHSYRVGLFGPSNAGKSTLMNVLCGTKVSIVSEKVQTTRERVVGIVSDRNRQVVFLDTPGSVNALKGAWVRKDQIIESWRGVPNVDHALLVLDATLNVGVIEEDLLKQIMEMHPGVPISLVLNKVDRVKEKPTLIDKRTRLEKVCKEFHSVYMVSALKKDHTDDIKVDMLGWSVPRKWEYNADQRRDMSDIQLLHEIVREKIFKHCDKDIPYIVRQETVGWTKFGERLRIDHDILVNRPYQIIVQKEAAAELTDLWGRPVYVDVQIRVDKKSMRTTPEIKWEASLLEKSIQEIMRDTELEEQSESTDGTAAEPSPSVEEETGSSPSSTSSSSSSSAAS